MGLRSTSSKGATSVLQTLADLNKELPSPFLINSGFVNQAFLVMQNRFMKQIITDTIIDWKADLLEGPNAGRHGFVTNGNHTFFHPGVLLTNCAFSTVLAAWVPVLYTQINGQSTEHHHPHFRHLNFAILMSSASPSCGFESKYLSAVHELFLHMCIYCILSI